MMDELSPDDFTKLSKLREALDRVAALGKDFVRLHKEFGQVMSKVTCIATKTGDSWRMKSTME